MFFRALTPLTAALGGTLQVRKLRPWFYFLALWIIFDVPHGLGPRGFDWGFLRPSIELPLMVIAYLVLDSRRDAQNGPVRLGKILLGLLAALLMVYRLDETVWRALMRSEPLIYDQVVMARHAFVLVSDLLSWTTVVVLTLVACSIGAWVSLCIRFLCRLSQELGGERSAARDRFLRGLSALALVLTLTQVFTGWAAAPRLVSLSIFANAKESLQLKQSLTRSVQESPYRRYAQIKLIKKPSVEIFFVESYGRLLEDDPVLRLRYRTWLKNFESTLTKKGLSAVSSFSEAPVSGGRSWIAEASVLMGTKIQHEVVFQDLASQMDAVPHLVRFFEQQGYSTLLLAPADRVRLGVSDDNRYGYHHYVDFAQLAYTGPAVGWGIIPDHFSLAHVETQVLPRLSKPMFFNFHMVTSHAPWSKVPDRSMEGGKSGTSYPLSLGSVSDHQETPETTKRLRRLRRDKDHRFQFFGKLNSVKRQAYGDAIEYELAVIADYLGRSDGERLTIVMGDHQPPVVAEANDSFDVPIHVLSTSDALLAPFIKRGFGPGMIPSRAVPDRVRHEDLFSLIVSDLVGYSNSSEASAPNRAEETLKK